MKQTLTIIDLSTINYLMNKEIAYQEGMANEPEYDFTDLGKRVYPSKEEIEERLKKNLFYQDLIHLKNSLSNICVVVETAEIKNFKCEICGEITPIECEGSAPNTCAMCMPIKHEEKERNNGNY